MKRRSVGNDPLSTRERDRGVIVKFPPMDLDSAVPASQAIRPEGGNTPRK